MTSKPKTRIELHIHLDGAMRRTTLWELLKSKNLPLPGDGSLEALHKAFDIKEPTTLCDYLSRFEWLFPVYLDDPKVIERVAYEFCEDKANDGVLYAEVRFSPHLMVSGTNQSITVRHIVQSCLDGLQKGEKEFGLTVRVILVCMRCFPEYAGELVELCNEFKDAGVVGIDVAGDESPDVDAETGVLKYDQRIVDAYQEAARLGIRRTVHAGEAGPANGVITAVELLKAERIGHGYHVLEDETTYKKVIEMGIHFEACPHSSILTGSVPSDILRHPIIRYAEDGVSFSIGTDDPTITASSITSEYKLLYDWGLTECHIIRANFNALRASFLPVDEKRRLLDSLKQNLNVSDL